MPPTGLGTITSDSKARVNLVIFILWYVFVTVS